MKKFLGALFISLGLTGVIAACPIKFTNDTQSPVIVVDRPLTQGDKESWLMKPGSWFGPGKMIEPGKAEVVKPNKDREFFLYSKLNMDIPVQKLQHVAQEKMSTTIYQPIAKIGFINILEGKKVECEAIGDMPRELTILQIKDGKFGKIKTEGIQAGTKLIDFMEKSDI
jgi:hypothetical protein